jgi:hypothetical protein
VLHNHKKLFRTRFNRIYILEGLSNWATDTPLKGIVQGLTVSFTTSTSSGDISYKPDQICRLFTISIQVRFDVLGLPQQEIWQRAFEFGNGPEKGNIWLGQLANVGSMARCKVVSCACKGNDCCRTTYVD